MSQLLRIFASAHTGNVLRRALALAETGFTRMINSHVIGGKEKMQRSHWSDIGHLIVN